MKMSVRSRIVIVAAIPLLGFLFNKVVFTVSKSKVEHAFETVERASALTDNSRELSGALATMRIRTRDFAKQPGQDQIRAFETAHTIAVKALATIEASVGGMEQPKLAVMQGQLSEIAASFADLAHRQESLGYTDSQGTRARMIKTANAVERIIHDDLSWVETNDAHRLLTSLLTMRRFESEYRLTRSALPQSEFFFEFDNFNALLGSITAAEAMKAHLGTQVRDYKDTFAEWIAIVGKVEPLIASIEFDIERITDRKSTRLNSSHVALSRMPSSA